MKVVLDIPDRVWADFCIYLEDNHHKLGCHCESNPSSHLTNLFIQDLIILRARRLSDILAQSIVNGTLRTPRAIQDAEDEARRELDVLIKSYIND